MKKKTFWRTAVLVFALAASTIAVHAEDYTKDEGFAVTFTGEGIESNFTSSQIAAEISELQPGDSVTINVGVKNSDSRSADFYLNSQVLSSLEDSQASASGGAYGYSLIYTGPSGEELSLYDSDTIGGDSTSQGEGLHKVQNGSGEYIYLDGLGAGQNGKVAIRVALDGETQGNGYQNTFANMQLNFAVERGADGDGGGNGSNGGNGGSGGGGNGGSGNGNGVGSGQPGQSGTGGGPGSGGSALFTQGSVYTGDAGQILTWSLAALLSGLLLLAYGVYHYYKKQRRGKA